MINTESAVYIAFRTPMMSWMNCAGAMAATTKLLAMNLFLRNQEQFRGNQCAECILNAALLSAVNTLHDEAVPTDHWRLIKKFNSELDKLVRFMAARCSATQSTCQLAAVYTGRIEAGDYASRISKVEAFDYG